MDSAKSKLGWTDYNAYTDDRIGFFINDDSKIYAGGAIDLATLKIKVGNDADVLDLSDPENFATSTALDTQGEEIEISFPVVPILTVPSLELVPAKASTCEEKGNNEYWKCSCGDPTCNRVYKADMTTKTDVAAETLELAPHDFTAETVDEKFLSTAATCIAPAKYFKSCTVCDEKGTETFTNGVADPNKHTNITVDPETVKAATCTEDGYSGDGICADCGAEGAKGQDIPALGHTGGEATCIAKAECTRCGEEYGDVDPNNHKNTETRDAKAATEEEEGYTGDTYCTDCETVMAMGTSIPKLSPSDPTPTPPSSGIGSVTLPSSPDSSTSSESKPEQSSSSTDSTSSNTVPSNSSNDTISSNPTNSGTTEKPNPSTGIAVAVIPVVLAAGATVVIIMNKKR